MDQLIQNLDLPGYRIEEKIGEGASGVVYRAQQTRLERPVAIKLLHPSCTEDPEYMERFRRDLRTAGNLQHPCIVQVYDVGEQDGLHYCIMEFVEGKTLAELIEEQGRIAPESALKIGMDTARALTHIQKIGLMHRDIKPKNIMITDEGTAKLCDPGIARKVRCNETTKAEEEDLLGTPYYISPEQALGEELDIRSDIYALGATLYHAVTGRVPFKGSDVQTIIKKHEKGDPVEPQKINRKLSPQFNELIKSMMAPDPGDRPQTPERLNKQLEAIQELQERSSKWRAIRSESGRRRSKPTSRFSLIILSVVGLMLAGGTFFFMFYRGEDRSGQQVSTKQKQKKEEGNNPGVTSMDKPQNDSDPNSVSTPSGKNGADDEKTDAEEPGETGETGEESSRSNTSDNESGETGSRPGETDDTTPETTNGDPKQDAGDERKPSVDESTEDQNPFALRKNRRGVEIASPDSSGSGGAFGRRGRRAYPKLLNRYERNREFEFTNELEVGQLSVWRIAPDALLIQGGLRNGLDSAIQELRLTLIVKTPDGETVEETVPFKQTVLPGEIVPFSTSIANVNDYDTLSYSFDYVPDPTVSGRKSMQWSDVKDQLPDPEEKFDTRSGTRKTVQSSQEASESPLLSLHGLKRLYGPRQGTKTETSLLKFRIRQTPSPVQPPSGQLEYQVLEAGTVQLDQQISIEPDRIQPAPGTFDYDSVEAGEVYRDEDNNMMYVVLYEAEGEHPSVRLNLRLTLQKLGTWTFLQVEPPFRNDPVPPDLVLAGKTNPSGRSSAPGESGEDETEPPEADGSSNTASRKQPSSTDEQETQSPSSRNPAWADTNWNRRVPVTVKAERVPSNLRDFPVYVDLSQMPDAFFNHVNSPGELRVTAADGQTPLPREVVSLRVSEKKGELHFRAKKLSSRTDTAFFIYYDNPEEPGPPDSRYQAPMVWANGFHGVWHLNNTLDSTSNENQGLMNGGMGSKNIVNGKIEKALTFDGSDDHVVVPHDSTLEMSDVNKVTIAVWVNKDTGQNGWRAILQKSDTSYNLQFENGDEPVFSLNNDGRKGNTLAKKGSAITLNTWHHLVGTFDGSTIRLYQNGSQEGTGSASQISDSSSFDVGIAENLENTGRHLDGTLDELRVASRTRSAAWVKAAYHNQNDSTPFLAIGTEQKHPQ